jgi:hypothetical protein
MCAKPEWEEVYRPLSDRNEELQLDVLPWVGARLFLGLLENA